jgi:hypothetical protein
VQAQQLIGVDIENIVPDIPTLPAALLPRREQTMPGGVET